MFDRVDTDAARAVHARCAAKPSAATLPPGARGASRSAIGAFAAATLVAITLVACGGGGDGGVGTNGTGITMGTVNGFGSVIVDGVRFDDVSARVEVDTLTTGGGFVAAEVKLGHRTRVEYAGDADDTVRGKATRIELDPSLTGVVQDKTTNAFVVLGQRVEINATRPEVPVTVYEGFADFSAISDGAGVEVHAIRLTSGTYLATRIENKSIDRLTGVVRVAGRVEQAGVDGTNSFRIGPLKVNRNSSTAVQSSGRTSLENGDSVVVFAPLSSYDTGTLTLTASRIRLRGTSANVASVSNLSGVVSSYVGGQSLVIDGIAVDTSGASESGVVANGVYVRVKGSFNSSGGFIATRIQVRDSDDPDSSELRGTVSHFVAANGSTPGSFIVRDTNVAYLVTPENCSSVTLGNGVFVEVKGVVTASGITASRIECKDASSVPEAVIEVHGRILSLPSGPTTGTFTVVTDTGEQVVAYGTTTFFRDLAVTDLFIGRLIEVEGVRSASVVNATKIKPDDN